MRAHRGAPFLRSCSTVYAPKSCARPYPMACTYLRMYSQQPGILFPSGPCLVRQSTGSSCTVPTPGMLGTENLFEHCHSPPETSLRILLPAILISPLVKQTVSSESSDPHRLNEATHPP